MSGGLRIVQITPGAGKMFCGACLRDNALVGALRRAGHDAVMIPLYLPLTLDEEDQSAGQPIFFGGVNVYLEQHSALFRQSPDWLRHWLAAPAVLNLAAKAASKARPEELGEMTISMLRGEEGRQARELDELAGWLRQEKPDVVCLSNALLAGLARRLKSELRVPVLCYLQGEDCFLDSLGEAHRQAAWDAAGERAADIDLFIAPSHYFAKLMERRLKLSPDRVTVVHNGILLDGYPAAPMERLPGPPVVGFFARMCWEKGLDLFVDAAIALRRRGRVDEARFRVGGSCGAGDEAFVAGLKERLRAKNMGDKVEFLPNLTRAQKLEFLKGVSIFSVPACYGEAFGLYVLEAMAMGAPVAQPDHGAFPELIAATGGGVLCAPGDAEALAEAVEGLLLDAPRARALGEAGRRAAHGGFGIDAMAARVAVICADAARNFASPSSPS